ncbi:MAG: exodeoxyribonuclease VII large subunit [Coriobacteriales bacterium]|nr:exodeoxyribonuclease VII large subunit [Coriobacteriales bacterium]
MAGGRNPLAGAGTGNMSFSMDGPEKGEKQALSVSEAVNAAKTRVKSMPTLQVMGEVTGFRGPNARSGHCYFQVKDDSSSMDVIVWRGTYAQLGAPLRDGMSIVLTGGFDVYVGTGRLSFIARSVELAGEGALRQKVAELARKLEAEGLMDPAFKRSIPRFCMRVAVVTSLSGSVIDDVKRTLRRRNPIVELDVVGCAVQGQHAPATIIRALQVAAAARPEAILLVRGGGSFEDLMTFNDEALARAVASCPVPVVTGIGHEPDTSICDMVADKRCSTPTAAAESVAPAIDEVVAAIEVRRLRMGAALGTLAANLSQRMGNLGERSTQGISARLARERATLEAFASRRCLEDPYAIVEDRMAQLMQSEQRLHDAIPRSLERQKAEFGHMERRLNTAGEGLLQPHEAELARAALALDALSPLKVLGRGYAITRDRDGHVVSDVEQLNPGQDVVVLLGKGSFDAKVTHTIPDEGWVLANN